MAQYFDDLCIWETWEYLEEKEAKKGGEQCSSLLRIFMQYTGFCPVKWNDVVVDMYPEIYVLFCVLVFTWMYNYWNESNHYFQYKGTFYLIVLDAQTLFLIIAQAVSIIWFFLRKWLRVYWEHIFVNFRTSRVTALYIMNILTCIRKAAEW